MKFGLCQRSEAGTDQRKQTKSCWKDHLHEPSAGSARVRHEPSLPFCEQRGLTFLSRGGLSETGAPAPAPAQATPPPWRCRQPRASPWSRRRCGHFFREPRNRCTHSHLRRGEGFRGLASLDFVEVQKARKGDTRVTGHRAGSSQVLPGRRGLAWGLLSDLGRERSNSALLPLARPPLPGCPLETGLALFPHARVLPTLSVWKTLPARPPRSWHGRQRVCTAGTWTGRLPRGGAGGRWWVEAGTSEPRAQAEVGSLQTGKSTGFRGKGVKISGGADAPGLARGHGPEGVAASRERARHPQLLRAPLPDARPPACLSPGVSLGFSCPVLRTSP